MLRLQGDDEHENAATTTQHIEENNSTNTEMFNGAPTISFNYYQQHEENEDNATNHDVRLNFEADVDRGNDVELASFGEHAGDGAGEIDVDENQAVHQLASRAQSLGSDVQAMFSQLSDVVQEAGEITSAHTNKHLTACNEIGSVVDACLTCAKRVRGRTLALAEAMPDLSELERRLKEVDQALKVLENHADAVLLN